MTQDAAVTAAAEAACDGSHGWTQPCDLCLEFAERAVPKVRERIAAEIEEYAAPIRKQYEQWLFTYGSAVEPGSRDPEAESMLTALFHAARIARGQT